MILEGTTNTKAAGFQPDVNQQPGPSGGRDTGATPWGLCDQLEAPGGL